MEATTETKPIEIFLPEAAPSNYVAEQENTKPSTIATKEPNKYRWVEGICANPATFIIYNADKVCLTVCIAYNKSEKAWFVDSHQKFIDSIQLRKLEVALGKVGGYANFEDALYSEVQNLLEWTLWQVENKGLQQEIFERVITQCNKILEARLENETAVENFLNKEQSKSTPHTEEEMVEMEIPNSKPQPEKLITKKVDGLEQIQIFDLPEVKQPRNPDAELFGYIAKNKIDRQRFKRKATQLIEKLKELPALERNALIRALNSKFTPPLYKAK